MAEKLNIIVFPWLAFGHILPFLELSKQLAKRGHRITFVSAPKNLNRLPKLPPHLSIHLVPIPLPQVPGLPADAEATSDVLPDQVQYLKKAFDALDVPFSTLVSESRPDWIIHDFAHHWIGKVAEDAGVPCVFFSVFNAAALAFIGPPDVLRKRAESEADPDPEEFTVSPEWVTFPSKVAYRRHEAKRVEGGFKPNASGVSDAYRIQVWYIQKKKNRVSLPTHQANKSRSRGESQKVRQRFHYPTEATYALGRTAMKDIKTWMFLLFRWYWAPLGGNAIPDGGDLAFRQCRAPSVDHEDDVHEE